MMQMHPKKKIKLSAYPIKRDNSSGWKLELKRKIYIWIAFSLLMIYLYKLMGILYKKEYSGAVGYRVT